MSVSIEKMFCHWEKTYPPPLPPNKTKKLTDFCIVRRFSVLGENIDPPPKKKKKNRKRRKLNGWSLGLKIGIGTWLLFQISVSYVYITDPLQPRLLDDNQGYLYTIYFNRYLKPT